jgi:hypothetical protein
VRLCFVVFVFSCLPMFFEHHYKTKCKKMRLGFRAIRCRKHRYLQCFVFIFMQKLRPWSPALRKNESQLLLFRGVGGPNLYATCFRVHPQVSFEITDLLSG